MSSADTRHRSRGVVRIVQYTEATVRVLWFVGCGGMPRAVDSDCLFSMPNWIDPPSNHWFVAAYQHPTALLASQSHPPSV